MPKLFVTVSAPLFQNPHFYQFPVEIAGENGTASNYAMIRRSDATEFTTPEQWNNAILARLRDPSAEIDNVTAEDELILMSGVVAISAA